MSNPDQEGSMRRKIKEKELLNNQEEGGGCAVSALQTQ